MPKTRRRITLPREVLLVEIERRCADQGCHAKTRLGLTKEEARAYGGFECERCERWNEDVLTERDIPDWWEDLSITALDALRPREMTDADEPGEVVARLSDAWRSAAREGRDPGDEHEEEDSF